MMMHRLGPAVLSLLLVAAPAHAQSLRGSLASMNRQNLIATQHDYTFLRTGNDVRRFVDRGYLVRIERTGTLDMANVSYPYAREQVRTFLNRLSSQYYGACGEAMVVTSLTRPQSAQPRNASRRSVHPTGMAIDLRIPRTPTCRSWLETTLLSLERKGVLDATRETRPPHYHVALYPTQYDEYVARLERDGLSTVPEVYASLDADASEPGEPTELVREAVSAARDATTYQVRRGDSLWTIARRHGTTVQDIKAANNLSNSRIYAGQVLAVPAR